MFVVDEVSVDVDEGGTVEAGAGGNGPPPILTLQLYM